MKQECGVQCGEFENATLYDLKINRSTKTWELWSTEKWIPPLGTLKFSSLLIPTTDSVRYLLTTQCVYYFKQYKIYCTYTKTLYTGLNT